MSEFSIGAVLLALVSGAIALAGTFFGHTLGQRDARRRERTESYARYLAAAWEVDRTLEEFSELSALGRLIANDELRDKLVQAGQPVPEKLRRPALIPPDSVTSIASRVLSAWSVGSLVVLTAPRPVAAAARDLQTLQRAWHLHLKNDDPKGVAEILGDAHRSLLALEETMRAEVRRAKE